MGTQRRQQGAAQRLRQPVLRRGVLRQECRDGLLSLHHAMHAHGLTRPRQGQTATRAHTRLRTHAPIRHTHAHTPVRARTPAPPRCFKVSSLRGTRWVSDAETRAMALEQSAAKESQEEEVSPRLLASTL